MNHIWYSYQQNQIEKSRDLIKYVVKKDEEGDTIFDENQGQRITHGINTLIYTIVKYFLRIPSNITSRIHD